MGFSISSGTGVGIGNSNFQNQNQNNINVSPKISAIISLIIGVVFIIIGYISYANGQNSADWTSIDGVVTSYESSTNTNTDTTDGRTTSSTSTVYTPVASYVVEGKTYTVKSSMSTSSIPQTGTKISVSYNPSSPSEAKVDQGTFGAIFPFIFMGVGALVLVFGVVRLIRTRTI